MKKILSLFLAVILGLTCLSIYAFPLAENTEDNQSPSGALFVSSVSGGRGGRVFVDIGLEANPGISAIQLQVEFDSERLQLVGAEDNGLFGETALSEEYDSPYVMAWVDPASEMSTATGSLCTLEFFVPYSLNAGDEVSVSVTCLGAFDTDYNPVLFEDAVGTVTAEASARGDLDGKDGITSADAIYLLYYTVLPSRYPLPEGMDVNFNKDDQISAADAIYLLYHTVLPGRYPI